MFMVGFPELGGFGGVLKPSSGVPTGSFQTGEQKPFHSVPRGIARRAQSVMSSGAGGAGGVCARAVGANITAATSAVTIPAHLGKGFFNIGSILSQTGM